MLIREIEVYGLFGLFDHKIRLNHEEKITLIHGPNGVGKTIILKMINNLFTLQNFEMFFKIPYKEFKLSFDSGHIFTVHRDERRESITNELEQQRFLDFHDVVVQQPIYKVIPIIKVQYQNEKNKTLFDFNVPFEELRYFKTLKYPESSRHLRQYLAKNHPNLERVSEKFWMDMATGERLTYGDLRRKYAYGFFFDESDKFKLFNEFISSVKIQLIETQRLLKVEKKKETSRYYSEQDAEEEFGYTVKHYSEGLANSIREYRDKYAVLTQKLDREFPFKLLNLKPAQAKQIDELKNQLLELEARRKDLIDFGLLDEDDSGNFLSMLSKIKDENRTVLTVYANDIQEKLQVFKDLAEKIKLFKEIIDKKFAYKHIKIGKNYGFAFSTKDGHTLSLTDLSSGEQHEIVLLYEFLFKIQTNSLILIDEPELSLHVAWQREFLDDLQRISKMSNLEFLIATHSPSIIADRDDLTVELAGI